MSAFSELGFQPTIALLLEEIVDLYTLDHVPWVVGYSGGKDSTAVLQLLWLGLSQVPPDQRHKPVYVINTDTGVENPVVSAWVTHSLERMRHAARDANLPIQPHQLFPALKDTFWVNLIGRGYPAPTPKFRWCTERLKIKPSNQFIRDVVAASGEAILALGTRKAESSHRGSRMRKLEKERVRERLSPSQSLPNCQVYSPVEDWTADDVWLFLMQVPNPWGHSNKELLNMYQGATEDGECPLVVDTSTPSCGSSRFGCWVCTLVNKDRSMSAMIQNDEDKEWMLPLLELRDDLDTDDKHLRDFRRTSGRVQLYRDAPIRGPYIQSARQMWLRKVLQAQTWVRRHGPPSVRKLNLIRPEELQEIRRIWVVEKHEFEDTLPAIYTEITGEPFTGEDLDDDLVFGAEDMTLLKTCCGDDTVHFELVRELLDVQQRFRTMVQRSGLYEALEAGLTRAFYTDEDDATDRARRKERALQAAERGEYLANHQLSENLPE